MRIAVLSYPMLFQREGGLQVQLRQTVAALNRLSSPARRLQAVLADPCRAKLNEFDVVHVFAAINGNYRIIEAAADLGVPTVLSPLVSPGWTGASGARARVADLVLGKVTHWNVQSSYAEMRRALELASIVIALGEREKQAIGDGFLIEASKVRMVPNGVGAQFFDADPSLFRERTGITGAFVLMAGSISPYKNQLGAAQALAELALPLVLIGHAGERDQAYLEQVRGKRGVIWLGAFGHHDPLLASAYAAASAFLLPSQGEIAPLSVMEALAAGTPVVMTEESALHFDGSDFALSRVCWNDAGQIGAAVMRYIAAPPSRERVRALVRGYTWDRVAAEVADCYDEALKTAHVG